MVEDNDDDDDNDDENVNDDDDDDDDDDDGVSWPWAVARRSTDVATPRRVVVRGSCPSTPPWRPTTPSLTPEQPGN